jgi:hypothetical protein
MPPAAPVMIATFCGSATRRHDRASRVWVAPVGSPVGPLVPGADRLPDPRLTLVYRLEATLGEPLDIGGRLPGAVVYEAYLVA